MKFLSVRNGGSGQYGLTSPLNIRGNELTPASVVKEDVTCWRSSSLKKEKESAKLQASSCKQRLTMVQGRYRMYLERLYYGKR